MSLKDDLEKMRQESLKRAAKFGAAKLEGIPVFEDCICYPIEDVVKLYREAAILQRNQDDSKWHEMNAHFISCVEEVKKKRLPDAPERTYLWPEGNMPAETVYTDNSACMNNHNPDFRPYYYVMQVPDSVQPKGAVVVCAGGDHGEPVLLEGYQTCVDLNAMGYQCFLLLNRTNMSPWTGKEAGADVARMIQIVRKNAAQYRISPDHVAYAGFSNGGLTGEQNVQYFSGSQTVKDNFPDYQPDEYDAYYGAPDVFINVYGPRFVGEPFNWEKVKYPPTVVFVGEADFNIPNIDPYAEDLRNHGVIVEAHTFAGVPHGETGKALINEVKYPSFELWKPLADAFMNYIYNT